MTLNPTCSEAVFRLGGRVFRIWTDRYPTGLVDELIETGAGGDYEPLDNNGGGADFKYVERMLKVYKDYKRKVLDEEDLRKIDEAYEEDLPILLADGEIHKVNRVSQLSGILLASRPKKVYLVPWAPGEMRELLELYRSLQNGRIDEVEFRAICLARSFWRCMDYVRIYGKYRYFSTKWYIGLRNEKLHATTRGRELDTVLAEEELGGKWATKLVTVDPYTQEVFFLPGDDETERAVRLAKNTWELEFLLHCPPPLVRAIEREDGAEIMKRISENISKLLFILEERGLLDNEAKAKLLAFILLGELYGLRRNLQQIQTLPDEVVHRSEER